MTAKPLGDDVLRLMASREEQGMNREELAALRDAIDTVLTWPDAVRAGVARWLTPEAAKPNGRDPHPPPIAPTGKASETEGFSATPLRAQARHGKPSSAKPAEQRLLKALQASPGSTVVELARAAGSGRSVAGERLRGLASRGVVTKDSAGHWRLIEDLAGDVSRAPTPRRAAVELTAGPETELLNPRPAAAHPPWLKPLGSYDRRETHEFQVSRYG